MSNVGTATTIEQICARHGTGRDALIPILQEVQDAQGFVSKEAVITIGKYLNLPASKIHGVATFYNQFRFHAPGRFHVQVCRGTACHVKGSSSVLDALRQELGVEPGQTTRDKLFSLEVVACIGACGLAPVIAVNGQFHASVTRDEAKRVIKNYRKSATTEAAPPEPLKSEDGEPLRMPPEGERNCRCVLHHALGTDAQADEKGREVLAKLRREDVERPTIFVGIGTCGLGAGADRVQAAAKKHLEATGIAADFVDVGCIGLCAAEPILDVQLPGRLRVSFGNVSEKDVGEILDAAIAGRIPREKLLGQLRGEGREPWPNVQYLDEHPFFAPQKRFVLKECGLVDPGSIDEALARGAYKGLARVLREKTPLETCKMVEAAGLRGRGGAGFPTGVKWKLALETPADQRVFICNADEGDPGAFMDRAVIEGDPHRLVEGLAIGAYAIGATKAYVYIRAEYPLAIARLETAIAQAEAYGLLGENILDSGFELQVIVKKGAGAFVCGEETALMHSIEGRRGMPRPRPPYPSVRGVFGKPTVINNVETLANLPLIGANGPEWFSAIGTASSKGTKVFALSGKIRRTGLVEVAMGTPLRQIVTEVGGGPDEGRTFKAVQIGGPSGGCIPEKQFDILVDYESLKSAGAMMGSGGLVAMDDKTCMVDVAKYFMGFIQRESCGKCIPCREGTRRMLEILERITHSRRNEKGNEALERFQGVMNLERLADVIRDTSLCGLGNSAPNPVLSTLRSFRDEYEAHVYERTCSAGVCKELLTYTIDAEECNGCGVCLRQCPTEAIMGAKRAPHYIVPDKCIACGACADACRFNAVRAA
jgi:NADH:ubiquinone oxidoreductase subunit F (NADH-binding)/NADH:ubiquinone oxidoreductase subunit E/ferredoxin